MGQAKKAVKVFSVHTVQCTMYTLLYSVHIVQTVQCTQCTHPLLETSPAVLCTYSTAELLSHMEVGPEEDNLPQALQRGGKGP